KLDKDERILYLAMAGYDQEQGSSATWYLLMFTTAQLLRLPAMLVDGGLLSAINNALDTLSAPQGQDRIIDVEALPYGDIQCFEIWSMLDGHLTLRLANGEREVYTIKDWGEQHKIGSFLRRYVKECASR
ncbi:MAG TPA: hypothetical protein VMF29_03400, partial [Candidatus Edwardsbacteria bacterium]|nr:hypothetical protein [Candidatus Edwardsbacteria bacterium]